MQRGAAEILTDHPDRFRAMIVESSNPAHSLADSARCREAFESLELMVVIDVAMTETARLAHYVLPAASQYEKPEATFFNLEFPHNTFHLRHPLLEPLPGHAARARDLGAAGARARRRRRRRAEALRAPRARAAPHTHRRSSRRSAPTRDGQGAAIRAVRNAGAHTARRPFRRRGAVGAAQKAAMTYPEAVRRAGHADGNALFDAILQSRSGVTFTAHEYEDDFDLIAHADHKIALDMPEMLDEIRGLR